VGEGLGNHEITAGPASPLFVFFPVYRAIPWTERTGRKDFFQLFSFFCELTAQEGFYITGLISMSIFHMPIVHNIELYHSSIFNSLFSSYGVE
jgi:hypothetical protein